METNASNSFELNTLKLRPAQPEDQTFLRHLFALVNEVALGLMRLEAVQRETLLNVQFTAQQQSYQLQFPGAVQSIVLFDGAPAGQIYVARTQGEIRLVDISILPRYQSSGIGTYLLRLLQAEAAVAALPIRLSVLRNNQEALRLYLRLGFVITGTDDVYHVMQWLPPSAVTPGASG